MEKLSREETTEDVAHGIDHRESEEGAAQRGLSGNEDVHGTAAGRTSSKGISSDVESREKDTYVSRNCSTFLFFFKLNFRPLKNFFKGSSCSIHFPRFFELPNKKATRSWWLVALSHLSCHLCLVEEEHNNDQKFAPLSSSCMAICR